MRIKTQLQTLVGAGAMAMSCLALAGTVEQENEPNHTFASAQKLTDDDQVAGIRKGVTVEAYMGDGDYPFADFYKFYAQKEQEFSIRIEDGLGGDKLLRTVVAVFNPDGDVMHQVVGFDEDPSIDFKAETERPEGWYRVGVINWPRQFEKDGEVASVNSNTVYTGDYKLAVEPAVAPGTTVNIRVRPGAEDEPPLNLKANGKIPVAILSDSDFEALTIDRSSLTFGPAGSDPLPDSLHKCNHVGRDVNGDGQVDLICYFDSKKIGWEGDETQGKVMGETVKRINGKEVREPFEGTGYLGTMPYLR